MRFLAGLLALILIQERANAGALTSWQSLPTALRSQISNDGLFVKGVGVNTWYALEVDPATGLLPVTGSFTFSGLLSEDHNYGVVGANTLRTAAQVGNATGAADFGAGATSAQTLRVVLPTNQTAIPVTITGVTTGRSYVTSVRNDYSSTNVGTVSWVQLIASTPAAINALTLFDSCGQTLELGTGGVGSETRVAIIPPGGLDGQFSLAIASATRVSVRAISATCSVGELDITGFN